MSLQYQYWLFTLNSLGNVLTPIVLTAILLVLLRMRKSVKRALEEDLLNGPSEEQLNREFEAHLELLKKERQSGRVHEVPPGPMIGYTEQQLREMPFEEFEAIKRSGHLEDQLRRAARREQRFDDVMPSQENG